MERLMCELAEKTFIIINNNSNNALMIADKNVLGKGQERREHKRAKGKTLLS